MRKLSAILLLMIGCAAPVVSLKPPSATPKASEYVDELKRWTRHGQLQHDFEVALSVDATMMSPEFRAAYAERVVSVYRYSEEEAARKRAEILAEDANFFTFHLETAAHNWQTNDLSGSKSIWRISLVNDQGREIPTTDIHSSKSAREYDISFYPYGTEFSKPWFIRVPSTFADGSPLVTAETKTLTLRFAGPPGSIDLVWLLK